MFWNYDVFPPQLIQNVHFIKLFVKIMVNVITLSEMFPPKDFEPQTYTLAFVNDKV